MHYYINASIVCDIGKIRTNNEDNFLFNKKFLKERHAGLSKHLEMKNVSADKPMLFGVFDGMGGHAKGERASFIAAVIAKRNFEKNFCVGTEEGLLRDVCITSNNLICQEMQKEKSRIGSTASMLLFHNENVWVCNIGDSPVFRYRDGKLEPVYEEHTDRPMREKLFGKEAVKDKKFPLTQHLGIFPEEMEIAPYISKMHIESGNQYIICSDGLSDMVSEEEICNVLNYHDTISQKVVRLKELALDHGGKDNVTIIGIEVVTCN